jgi:outer membrane protein TolC
VSKTASSLFVTAALTFAVAANAGAQQQQQTAPDTDHVKALIEQAKVRLNVPTDATQAQAATQSAKVDMTADEAVARALERNLTLASQRLTPQTFDYNLAASRAFYRPNVTSQVSNNSTTQLGRLTTDGGLKTNQDTAGWNAGVTQNVSKFGGSYQVNWTNNRQVTTQTTAQFLTAYTTGFQAQYTQPLLANFKIDNTRTQLLTTAIQQDQAELDLQATTASTVAQVRNAYWELVFGILNLENQRASLDLSSKLVQDNRARVEIGTMAPIDIVQAQAEEATRRQALVNAEATLQNTELALKRLIVSGTDDPLWTATLNATDRPGVGTEVVDLEAAVRNALANRTDLLTQKKTVDSANITLRSLRNQALPTLNLVGTYRLDGRGGLPSDTTIPPSNWWDALGGVGNFEAPTWTMRLDFSYPLGTSQAEANKARQEILLRQNQASIKATELQIATEVTAAAIAIRSSLEAIQAATAARELSIKRAEAAQSKLDVGMATNFEVVQAQRDLADARNRELREHLNYRRAIVDFQRTQISPR